LTVHLPEHVTWHVAAPVQSIVEPSPALTMQVLLSEQS
jgi:hypothetical protein